MSNTQSGEVRIIADMEWEIGQFKQCVNKRLNRVFETRGGGRARYLQRERQLTNPDLILPGSTVWTDYDGDDVYGDYVVNVVNNNAVVTPRITYLPGIGQAAVPVNLSGKFPLRRRRR